MAKALMRGLVAAVLALTPFASSAPVHAAETLPLAEAVASLQSAVESRDGCPWRTLQLRDDLGISRTLTTHS
ncbi:hypothetical protein ACFUVU_05465 [Streptomyces griseoincarnatus]